MKNQYGLSVIEVILAAALFMIFATGAVTVVIGGLTGNRLGEEQTIASQYASEGLEAARSIRNQNFNNLNSSLCSNGAGVNQVGGVWAFKASGTTDTFGKYTRTIKVCDVLRDGIGNIVATGGSADSSTKKITSTVTWNVTPSRANSVVLDTYLTNYEKPKGGLLVYGDGGTTSDAVRYKVFDNSIWSTAVLTADIDSASTNRALRSMRLYSSPTRDEKLLISRHYRTTGQLQSIYAQVFNGTTWGNVQELASWSANTFLDVRNFDGAYLANGNFVAIYSNNTSVPQSRTWDGSSWSAAVPLQDLASNGSGIPVYISASSRPNTNEVMAGFFGQARDTNTQYFNGATNQTSNWTLHTRHASNGVINTKQVMDFAWSPNLTTTGALVFTDANNDRNISARMFVANGSGGGAWGTIANTAVQSSNVGAISLIARAGANEFHFCDKDATNIPRVICYKLTFSGSTAAIANPTNPMIVASSDTGIQRSFDIGFESLSGATAVGVFSDNTNIPRLKKYTASTSSWDSATTTITMTGFTLGNVETIRITPQPQADDLMILIADGNLDVYSVFWNGSTNAVYTTPAVKAVNRHGQTGSAVTEFWYDFAWD